MVVNERYMNDIDNIFLRLCFSDCRTSTEHIRIELLTAIRCYVTMEKITLEQASFIIKAYREVIKELEKGVCYDIWH